MKLVDKIMSDIGFLDVFNKDIEKIIKTNSHFRLMMIREHLLDTHKELTKPQKKELFIEPMLKKDLINLFDCGLHALSERRQIKFNRFKQLKELIEQQKIEIIIRG